MAHPLRLCNGPGPTGTASCRIPPQCRSPFGNAGLRIRERMKSFTSLNPWASGIRTISYLSKAARMAGIAGSGVGSEPAGLAILALGPGLLLGAPSLGTATRHGIDE